MSIYGFRRAVACYVTRPTQQPRELLVFVSGSDGAESLSEVQIPVGRMQPFEGIEAAAYRQIQEQAGLTGVVFIAQLGGVERSFDEPDGPSVTTYVHLEAAADAPSEWCHTVTGERDDAGEQLDYRWEPLPLAVPLGDDQGRYLDAVTAPSDPASEAAV